MGVNVDVGLGDKVGDGNGLGDGANVWIGLGVGVIVGEELGMELGVDEGSVFGEAEIAGLGFAVSVGTGKGAVDDIELVATEGAGEEISIGSAVGEGIGIEQENVRITMNRIIAVLFILTSKNFSKKKSNHLRSDPRAPIKIYKFQGSIKSNTNDQFKKYLG